MILDYLDSEKTIAEVSAAQIAENALIQLDSEGSDLVQWDQSISSIYSKLTQTGFNELSTSDLTTLYDIAAMCPMLGGDLVFRARSIISLFIPGMVYQDSLACTEQGFGYRSSNLSFGDIIISPNPVHDLLKLEFSSAIPESELTIRIISTDGILKQDIEFKSSRGSINLDVYDLPPGIYILKIMESSGVWTGQAKFVKL